MLRGVLALLMISINCPRVRSSAESIATIAAAFHLKYVIVRMRDFKTNKYANLIGGAAYEPNI